MGYSNTVLIWWHGNWWGSSWLRWAAKFFLNIGRRGWRYRWMASYFTISHNLCFSTSCYRQCAAATTTTADMTPHLQQQYIIYHTDEHWSIIIMMVEVKWYANVATCELLMFFDRHTMCSKHQEISVATKEEIIQTVLRRYGTIKFIKFVRTRKLRNIWHNRYDMEQFGNVMIVAISSVSFKCCENISMICLPGPVHIFYFDVMYLPYHHW